jgi:methylmalonyl-CoA/ethylmalonyl-CoA epimerase
MFTRVDHIGLVVHDLDAAVALYSASFGLSAWEQFELPERHMRAAIANVGGTLIELITPTSVEAAFARYLAERGPGVHHIAYRVDDIAGALATLQQQGVRLIDEQPHAGMHNTLVAFVHPKAALGVLIELVQHQSGA